MIRTSIFKQEGYLNSTLVNIRQLQVNSGISSFKVYGGIHTPLDSLLVEATLPDAFAVNLVGADLTACSNVVRHLTGDSQEGKDILIGVSELDTKEDTTALYTLLFLLSDEMNYVDHNNTIHTLTQSADTSALMVGV